MNTRIKKLWLEALRSGQYKQGYRVLHRMLYPDSYEVGDVYCCLGVLTDLYIKDTGGGKWVYTEEQNKYTYHNSCNEPINTDILPIEVKDWAELDSCDPMLRMSCNKVDFPCSNTNDSQKHSFTEIANAIEDSL
jgi:hypothetical protein